MLTRGPQILHPTENARKFIYFFQREENIF